MIKNETHSQTHCRTPGTGNGHTDPDTKSGKEVREWLENWEQNMRPGDLLLQYYGKLKYCFYVGDGKFIVMDTGSANGTAPTIGGAEVLEACFTNKVKFFTLLRPSYMMGS